MPPLAPCCLSWSIIRTRCGVGGKQPAGRAVLPLLPLQTAQNITEPSAGGTSFSTVPVLLPYFKKKKKKFYLGFVVQKGHEGKKQWHYTNPRPLLGRAESEGQRRLSLAPRGCRTAHGAGGFGLSCLLSVWRLFDRSVRRLCVDFTVAFPAGIMWRICYL